MELLQLYDKNKNKKAGLTEYKDLCIESVLTTGDKKLSFSYSKEAKYYDEIVEEGYIRTKKDEFVIKARDVGVDYTRFDCVLNLEGLEANLFDRFESVEQTITNALNLAIVGTGWTVKDNTLKKKRTVRCTNKNALEIVQEIKKTYRVDIVFNTLSKQIEVYEHLGEDKGTYFIDSLNLTALQVQSDSYKFATRIIAEGKDGLTFADINGGKNYVENYQYSRKIKTIYWKDERYTIKESLLEDAKAKLKEISKPYTSYNASVLNLAELNPKYKNILDYRLGDTITLISRNNKVKDKQRIVKTIEYPQDHSRDTVELANAVLKFEDIQQENQETTSTVNNITTDNGTINGSTIDSITTKQIEDFEANVIKVAKLKAILAEIENLHVNKADIQNLNAVIARIGTLEATKASITELNAIHAIIQQIKAGKADITDLNAAVAKVGILENKTAVLENALAGNLTADNFKTNAITAGSAVIAEGAIGSLQISSLSVNKLEAGDITTSKHRIVSADGTIEIVGNQILINRNNVNRVVLGEYRKKDGTTEYGLLVRAKDGQTVMLDGNGVHNAGITDGAIDNNKVADNANISGNKLDINSVIREVNTHGTETIKGTKVTVGDRTLDVELSTQKNTITEHGKELSSQKATIQALDNAIKLKVDSQTFTQSTTTINNNINRAKEEAINTANSNTNNAINDMKIGIENLIDNGDLSFDMYKFQYADGVVNYDGEKCLYQTVNTNNESFIATSKYDFSNLAGKKITISFFGAKTNNVSSVECFALLTKKDSTKDWDYCLNKRFNLTEKLQYFEWTLELPTDSEKCYIRFDNNGSTDGANATLYITKIKVVEGTIKSAWSPSSNDLKKYSNDVAKAKSDLAKIEAIASADGKITEEERKRIQQAQENLNIAIAKAEKAKEDAINTASADATNKANNALNSAKAYTNTEITTVNTHLNKNTSEINILKGKIESKVSQSDIDKSISAIQIGGRNLVLNSDVYLNESGNIQFDFSDINEWRNKYVTISLDIDLVDAIGSRVGFEPSILYEDGTIQYLSLWESITTLKTKNGRISHTYKIEDKPIMALSQRGIYIQGLADGRAKIGRPKLEFGTKATDWTLAPEDLDQLIVNNIKTVTDKISTVESKLTQENNSIKASVSDLNSTTQSITTNVSNINRDLTNKINSNLDAAKNFATDKANEALNSAKVFVNAEITTVNSKVHNVESNLNILSDKINTKVSQSDVEKSISAIQLGGRNYLTNSIINKTNSDYLIAQLYFGKEKPKEGEEFTISIKGELGQGKRLFGVYNSGGNVSLVSLDKRDSNGIYRGTFNWIVAGTNNTHINIYTIDSSTVVDSTIEWVKLEKGNKVSSSWTPAPEDTDKAIADNIKIVDSKISDVSSTVTQLKNSVTTEINSINSKTTTLNGKIVNAETRLNSVEAKITDTSIINTVRREFYSKGETDNMYSSKSEVTQLSNSLEWKISTLGAGNLIKNSSFNGGFDCWIKNGNPSLSTNTDFLQDRYGKMISIEGGAREGIFQRFPTIPGEMYTVSFFAESDRQRQLETLIGIEGLNYITLKNKPGFRRWDFTFKATSTQHTFVAYLDQAGKFYLGRVMVTQGSILQEYREGQGIYSNIARFDVNGFTIESSSSNTRTITDSRGFRVQDISTGENLLEANARGVSAKGGRFYVDGHDGNYTLLWGRDITINGQRALVGTHSHPEPSITPNKLIVNYNNDFVNGVEIGGKLTNNTFPILSALGFVLDANGYIELNNGLIIQYGSVTGIPIKNGNIVDTPVRYRKRFPHACISFLASIDTVDKNNYLASNFNSVSHTNGQEAGWFYAKNLTNDKFGALMDINYIAIGY